MKRTLRLCLVLVITGFLSLGCMPQQKSSDRVQFDKTAWIADQGQRRKVRRDMIEALEQQLFVGMSVDEVIELMGNPDAIDEPESGREGALIFDLGLRVVDHDSYNIYFDKNKKVTSFGIVYG